MFKSFSNIIILFCLCTTISSCKKDNERLKITNQTMEMTIKANESYVYDLGYLCDECGLTINKQATHYQISQITLDTTSLNLKFIYNYQPSLNYTGTDEVEIKHSAGSDGSSPNNIINLTTIKFTIIN